MANHSPDDTRSPDSSEANPKPKKLPDCVVCGDYGSRVSFGVFLCYACKSFFHRAVTHVDSASNLTCLAGHGECVISKSTRKKCSYCRLKKCLAVGMSKSACVTGRRSYAFMEEIQNLLKGDNKSQNLMNGTSSENTLKACEGLLALRPEKDTEPGASELLDKSRRSSIVKLLLQDKVRNNQEGSVSTSKIPFLSFPSSFKTKKTAGVYVPYPHVSSSSSATSVSNNNPVITLKPIKTVQSSVPVMNEKVQESSRDDGHLLSTHSPLNRNTGDTVPSRDADNNPTIVLLAPPGSQKQVFILKGSGHNSTSSTITLPNDVVRHLADVLAGIGVSVGNNNDTTSTTMSLQQQSLIREDESLVESQDDDNREDGESEDSIEDTESVRTSSIQEDITSLPPVVSGGNTFSTITLIYQAFVSAFKGVLDAAERLNSNITVVPSHLGSKRQYSSHGDVYLSHPTAQVLTSTSFSEKSDELGLAGCTSHYWSIFERHFNDLIYALIVFAKQHAPFDDLSPHEQHEVLKRGAFECVCLVHTVLIDCPRNFLLLPTLNTIATASFLSAAFDQTNDDDNPSSSSPPTPSFFSSLFEVTETSKITRLSMQQFALFLAFNLFNPEFPSQLRSREEFASAQTQMFVLLSESISTGADDLMPDLLLTVSELKRCANAHRSMLQALISRHGDAMKFEHDVHREIFDLP